MRALTESGLDPHCLEIELTESAILQDNEAVALLLRELRTIGVSVALDDFGTGYSSLSYLSRFPLDAFSSSIAASCGICARIQSQRESLPP
jgi:EAL domain-containing protein (putative c-di-GMP-specific phosphodiesterase class I)